MWVAGPWLWSNGDHRDGCQPREPRSATAGPWEIGAGTGIYDNGCDELKVVVSKLLGRKAFKSGRGSHIPTAALLPSLALSHDMTTGGKGAALVSASLPRSRLCPFSQEGIS